jgi:hypothetical protein
MGAANAKRVKHAKRTKNYKTTTFLEKKQNLIAHAAIMTTKIMKNDMSMMRI